jgi:ABC-type glycerol-3-phosphate transport system substrate-binding protein
MKYLYSVESMAKWTEGTGDIPPRTEGIEEEKGGKSFVKTHQIFNAAASQMDGIAPCASFPGDAGLQAEQMMIDMRDRILSGSDVKESLTTTQDEINKLLKP